MSRGKEVRSGCASNRGNALTWLQQKPKILPPVTDTQNSAGNMGEDSNSPGNPGGRKRPYGVVALVAIVVAVAAVAYYKNHRGQKGVNAQDLRVERVTRSGKATTAAISPDGQLIAYVLRDGAQQSLVLRQLGAEKETQLTAPEAISYAGVAFSPDGTSLYYTASSKENQLYSYLYKIPLQGGQPVRLVEDIDTAVSFSPDAKRFAFVRGVPDKRLNDLVVANADGSDLKVIARRPGLVYAASLIAPAWSPDGKTIVFTNYQTNKRFLLAVAPDGSGLRELYKSRDELGRAQWLPDGSAMLVPVREANLGERGQIWKVDFPSARAERVTNDPRDYSLLWFGVDQRATSLASVETTITGDLWMLPDGDSTNEKQVTTGGALIVYVSKFGRDKILYETREGRVFTADTDGGNAKQVSMAAGQGIRDVSACGDGKHIVYQEMAGEDEDIWRVDADGSNAVRLTNEKSASMPTCTPDGRWVLYWNDEEHSLYRVPTEGGSSTKVNLLNVSSPYVRFSPDGKFVIYNSEKQEQAKSEYKVVIAPASGGAPTATFPMVPGMGMAPPQWAADGKALYMNLMRQGAANIWKMESPGGPMTQVTNFPSGLIASFTWSQDGKTLYVARGTRSTDVVLLKAAK